MNEVDPFTDPDKADWNAYRRSGFPLNASERAIARSTAVLNGSKVRRCENANCELAERETTAAAMIEGFIMRFICRPRKPIGRSLSTALYQRRAIKAERLINLASRVRILMSKTCAWGSRPAINYGFKYGAPEALKRDEKLQNKFKGEEVMWTTRGYRRDEIWALRPISSPTLCAIRHGATTTER